MKLKLLSLIAMGLLLPGCYVSDPEEKKYFWTNSEFIEYKIKKAIAKLLEDEARKPGMHNLAITTAALNRYKEPYPYYGHNNCVKCNSCNHR